MIRHGQETGRAEDAVSALSVREYAECYLMSRAGELAPKSSNNAEKAVAALLEYLGVRAEEPLADFRAADADGFAAWALGRVRRPTVCKYVAYLTPMFALAERDETLSFNPFDGLEVPEGGAPGGRLNLLRRRRCAPCWTPPPWSRSGRA